MMVVEFLRRKILFKVVGISAICICPTGFGFPLTGFIFISNIPSSSLNKIIDEIARIINEENKRKITPSKEPVFTMYKLPNELALRFFFS